MARIQAGTTLDVTYVVQADLGRSYSFSWPLGDSGDVSVEHNGEAVVRTAYAVTVAIGGVGGSVRFLTPQENAGAITLAAGDRVRILRDTVTRERASFGASGFASSGGVRAMSAHIHRVLEELADRLEVQAEISLTGEQIRSLITGQVKEYAVSGGRRIALGDLLETDADQIEDAFVAVGFNPTTRVLTMTTNDGRTQTAAIPGSTIPVAAAGDVGEPLVGVLGAPPRYAPVEASKVAVDASGFTGNLATTDDTAQKVADKVDGLTTGAGDGGLDTDAVNAAIDARVPSWARMTRRWTDEEREAIHAFTGDAWQQSADIEVATTFSSVVRPANPENFTFAQSTSQGPRYTNVFAIVRLRTSRKDKLQLARFRIADPGGDADQYQQDTLLSAASGVTFLEDELGWSYYTVAVADYPAGETYSGELLVPFMLDPDKVAGLPAPWAVRGQPRPSVADYQLRNGALAGLSVTHSARNVFGNLQLYSPAVDLDADDYSRTKFSSRVRVTLSQKSDAGISFHATNVQDSIEISGFTFSSLITEYTAGQTTGDKIAEAPIHLSGGTIGTVELYLADNAGNELGVQVAYKGSTGSSSFALGFHEVADAEGVHPADGGGGSTVQIAGKDVALGTNRKTVTPNTSQVVRSDWGVINLTNDATTAAGFTVVSNEMVFSTPGLIIIKGSLMVQGDGTGGGSRIYADVRARITDAGGTVSRPLYLPEDMYNKSAPDGSLAQGPDDHVLGFTFPIIVATGDKIALEWQGYFQSQTNVDIQAAESGIRVFTGFGGGGGGGASTLLALTDTPSSFAGQAGKFLAVDAGESSTEFVDPPRSMQVTHPLGSAAEIERGTTTAAREWTPKGIHDGVDLMLPAATQAEAEAGTGTRVRAFTPQRVAQAIAALASVGWSRVTGKPATATRWPSFAEVTGTKPPSNAEPNPAEVTKAEAEAGTSTAAREWTPQRVKQAIDALGGVGTLYSSVYDLPTASSLPTGTIARVAQSGQASVSLWMVDGRTSGTRFWRMLSGRQELVDFKANIVTALTWVDSGVSLLRTGGGTIFDPFDWLSFSVDNEIGLQVVSASRFKNLPTAVVGGTAEPSTENNTKFYQRFIARVYYTGYQDVLYDIARTSAGNLALRTNVVRSWEEFNPLRLNGVPG